MDVDGLLVLLAAAVLIAVVGAIVACVGGVISWRGARAANRTLRRFFGEDEAEEQRRQQAARLR